MTNFQQMLSNHFDFVNDVNWGLKQLLQTIHYRNSYFKMVFKHPKQ